jgi:hypothetical protein
MHLDADENWHAGGDLDIYSVALHEAGHAIGLGHSDKPGDVMYPYYRRNMSLSANDIGAAQSLYGIPGAPTGGSTPAPSPLHLTLNPGLSSTQANQTSMTGTVSGGVPPVSIQWQTDHGYSGQASVTNAGSINPVAWTAGAIPLAAGSNTVTVTAFDAARQAVSQTAGITLSPAVTSSGPIAVAITSPASVVVTVNAAAISLAGTAAGGAGVTRVTWQTSSGATGTATGIGPWMASSIPLLTGTNTIVIRAYDAKGASGWASLVAVRH